MLSTQIGLAPFRVRLSELALQRTPPFVKLASALRLLTCPVGSQVRVDLVLIFCSLLQGSATKLLSLWMMCWALRS